MTCALPRLSSIPLVLGSSPRQGTTKCMHWIRVLSSWNANLYLSKLEVHLSFALGKFPNLLLPGTVVKLNPILRSTWLCQLPYSIQFLVRGIVGPLWLPVQTEHAVRHDIWMSRLTYCNSTIPIAHFSDEASSVLMGTFIACTLLSSFKNPHWLWVYHRFVIQRPINHTPDESNLAVLATDIPTYRVRRQKLYLLRARRSHVDAHCKNAQFVNGFLLCEYGARTAIWNRWCRAPAITKNICQQPVSQCVCVCVCVWIHWRGTKALNYGVLRDPGSLTERCVERRAGSCTDKELLKVKETSAQPGDCSGVPQFNLQRPSLAFPRTATYRPANLSVDCHRQFNKKWRSYNKEPFLHEMLYEVWKDPCVMRFQVDLHFFLDAAICSQSIIRVEAISVSNLTTESVCELGIPDKKIFVDEVPQPLVWIEKPCRYQEESFCLHFI